MRRRPRTRSRRAGPHTVPIIEKRNGSFPPAVVEDGKRRRETTVTPTAAGRGHAEERNQRRSRRASHVPQVAMHALRARQPSDDWAPQRVSVFMLATQSQSLFGWFALRHIVESRQCAEIHSYSSATSAYTPRVASRGRRGGRSGHGSSSWIVVDRHGLPWVVEVAVRVAKSGRRGQGRSRGVGVSVAGHGHGHMVAVRVAGRERERAARSGGSRRKRDESRPLPRRRAKGAHHSNRQTRQRRRRHEEQAAARAAHRRSRDRHSRSPTRRRRPSDTSVSSSSSSSWSWSWSSSSSSSPRDDAGLRKRGSARRAVRTHGHVFSHCVPIHFNRITGLGREPEPNTRATTERGDGTNDDDDARRGAARRTNARTDGTTTTTRGEAHAPARSPTRRRPTRRRAGRPSRPGTSRRRPQGSRRRSRRPRSRGRTGAGKWLRGGRMNDEGLRVSEEPPPSHQTTPGDDEA